MRLRWLKFKAKGLSMPDLARRMLTQRYAEGRNWGFTVDEQWGGVLHGRYVERREFIEEIEDPLGGIVETRRVEFVVTSFRLEEGFPVLELEDPPRSVRGLVAQLGALTDYDAVIEPLAVSVSKALTIASGEDPTLQVLRLRCSSVPLGASVSARVEVSGISEVRRQAESFLGGRKASYDLVRVLATLGGERHDAVLRGNGALATRTEIGADGRAAWRRLVWTAAENA